MAFSAFLVLAVVDMIDGGKIRSIHIPIEFDLLPTPMTHAAKLLIQLNSFSRIKLVAH